LVGAIFFVFCTAGRAYSFAPRGLFLMPLLGAPQEVAEEGRQGVPPWIPLGSRRGVAASGVFVPASAWQGFLPSRFVQNSCKHGRVQVAKKFIFIRCVLLPCWRFSVKTPTQNLNLLVSAKTLAAYAPTVFAPAKGGLGGNGRVSFLVTSWEMPRSDILAKRAALWRA
jgi:hypothetical protein